MLRETKWQTPPCYGYAIKNFFRRGGREKKNGDLTLQINAPLFYWQAAFDEYCSLSRFYFFFYLCEYEKRIRIREGIINQRDREEVKMHIGGDNVRTEQTPAK